MGPRPQETFQHTITTHQRCGGGCPQPAHDGRRVLAGWRVSWVLFLGPCLLQPPPAQVIAPARKREDEELSAAAGPRACRVGAGSARKLRGSCCLVLRLSKAGSHRGEAAASGTPQEQDRVLHKCPPRARETEATRARRTQNKGDCRGGRSQRQRLQPQVCPELRAPAHRPWPLFCESDTAPRNALELNCSRGWRMTSNVWDIGSHQGSGDTRGWGACRHQGTPVNQALGCQPQGCQYHAVPHLLGDSH